MFGPYNEATKIEYNMKTITTRSITSIISASAAFALTAPSSFGGVVSYFPFEGNALDPLGGRNGTLVSDASFSNNVPSAISARSQQSLSLDGNNDRVFYDVPLGDTISGEFSVGGWVLFSDVPPPSGNAAFFGTRGPGSTFGFDFKLRGNRLRVDIGDGTKFLAVAADSPVLPFSSDTWYHVAAVITRAGYNVFLDGVSVMTGSYPDSIPLLIDEQHDFSFGSIGGPITSNEDIRGRLDDFFIANSALTPAQIADIASGAQIVPEPTAVSLLGLAGVVLIGIGRRRSSLPAIAS